MTSSRDGRQGPKVYRDRAAVAGQRQACAQSPGLDSDFIIHLIFILFLHCNKSLHYFILYEMIIF